MDDNKSKLENIINSLQSNNENINSLEEALKKHEWSLDMFYITLISQIIRELVEIEKNIKDKEFNYNNKTSFLFQLINFFCNVKYHNYLNQEILQIITSKANVEFILNEIININNIKIDSIEKNTFIDLNNHIVNLLLTIMNLNDKALIDIIINYKDSTKLLNNLFNIFSENEYCRNFLYNLQRNFFKYYPNNNTYKENINFTISYLNKCLEKNIDYFFVIKEEINIILLLYKNDVEIIEDVMTILLMNIFIQFEKSDNNNFEESISSLFKNSFNNIVFSKKKNSNNNSNNTYNNIFINFLFKIYNELINLNLKKSYTIFFSQLFLSLDNQKNGISKYKWILQNTQFIKIILNSLIERKDENLLKIYLTKIMTLSAPNDGKNIEDCYIPDYDIYFLISNIKEIIKGNEENKSDESIIHLICSMIIKIININKKIVNIVLNKYKINDLILSLISSNKYNNNIKDILIDLLEEILKINSNNFHIDIQLNIQNDLEVNNINKKLYLLSILYENEKNNLETKFINIINKMILYINENNFETFFYYMEIIIKYILNKENNETYSIDKETISKINNIFIHASQIIIEHENNNEIMDIKGIKLVEIKKRLIYDLIKAVFTLNLNNFKNKLNKNKNDKIVLRKVIISENTIYLIIKNILCGQSKREIIEYIIYNICIQKEIYNKDKVNNKNTLFILKSPKLIYMIIVALYEIKDEESMLLIINKLNEAINLFEINIKLLLNFDIISILIKNILQNENSKLIKETKDLLNKMVEYLDEKSLINFISNLYIYLYNILINEKVDNRLKKEIIIDLFTILKNGISLSKKINHNYLSISNKKLGNPYIYNFFYISGLTRKNKIINYNINMKILNNYDINDFNLCTFMNNETLSLLSFIYDKNKIIIFEMTNKKEKKIIKSIDNIDNYLKKDNNIHNFTIIINFELLTINIKIDSNEIKLEDKIILSNNFSLYLFDIIIGYDKYNEENDISIIDISEILILNYDNEIDMNTIINKKKENIRNNTLEAFIFEKNNIIGEKILAEFNFQNNFNFIQSKNIKNISNLYYYFDGKKLNNKYIGNFKFQNPFINKSVDIFIISSDNNIEEYCSLNKIFIENKINKYIIKSFLSKKFDCSFNSYNYFFVDFLIGFLFIFEKKRKILLDKNNENKEKEENNNFDNNINDNNDFINDFIILIFKVIFELQNKNIINYFLYENDILNIKIKHFFERNIEIINDKDFVEKLLSIFKITNISDILKLENNISEEYSLNIIAKIFLDLIIFKKLKREII